jgi:hypothetical protein
VNKHSYIQAPFLSFFSRDFYRHISNEKSGTGFGYLFLLMAVIVVPTAIKTSSDFNAFINNETPRIITQVPEITITDGVASIEEPQPYTITHPDNNEPLIVIDTTGKISSLDDTDARMLITKSSILYEKSAYETRTYDLSDIEAFVVNQALINEWAGIAQKYFLVVVYPFMLIGLFLVQVIKMLIYAAIGIIFVKLLKSSNDYSSLLRLSVIAFTPVVLLETVLHTAGIGLPFSGIIFFLVAMAYLFFGVHSSRIVEQSE